MSEVLHNYCSDYSSVTSSGNSANFPSSNTLKPAWCPEYVSKDTFDYNRPGRQSASYDNLVSGKCTLEDIMKEFQMNGSEAPYTPAADKTWDSQLNNGLNGMGPTSAYLRQKSWPEPERTPAQRLPKRATEWVEPSVEYTPKEFHNTFIPVEDNMSPVQPQWPDLTEEQIRVLNSLPNAVIFYLLQELEQSRDGYNRRNKKTFIECRFCKNNGERESYYRSHSLKDARGRVTCPVLRAFVCARCGAHGDYAHTAKYCPLTTAEERIKSAAMMRSVRLASGRRRNSLLSPSANPADNYVMFGDTTPSVISDSNVYNSYAVTPLDPLWAALEQKLML